MFEKDDVVYDSEDEYELISEESLKKKVRIITISILLLIIVFFCYSCYKSLTPVDYRVFTEERTEFVEEKYMMDFSNIKLERYWTVSMAQDRDANFNFSGVEDYKYFMENNFHGEIVSLLYEDQVLDDGTVVEELREENLVAEYKCKAGKVEFLIEFYKDGDYYKAELVSY